MGLTTNLEVSVDDAVTFEFEVTNTGSDPLELTFRSGKFADIAVMDGGDEVWRWSDGQMFTQALGSMTIGPGDSIEERFVWEDPESGEYEAVATLDTKRDVVARAGFSV